MGLTCGGNAAAMALGVDGDRGVGPAPNLQPLTVSFWFRVTAPTQNSCVWMVEDAPGSNGYGLALISGVLKVIDNAGGVLGAVTLFTPTINVWYFVCFTIGSGVPFTWTAYYSPAAGAGGLTMATNVLLCSALDGVPGDISFAWDVSLFGLAVADADYADIKVWQAQLTAAQIANEYKQQMPFRTANMYSFWPCVSIEDAPNHLLVDRSGNGKELATDAIGDDPETSDGPPIPWKQIPARYST